MDAKVFNKTKLASIDLMGSRGTCRPFLANRQKLFVALMLKRCCGLFLAAFMISAPVVLPAMAGEKVSFASAQKALSQGVSAYRAGHYEIAIPALEFAASRNMFSSRYYLAKIYSDNNSSRANHGKAFQLLRQIVVENANVDPEDYRRAPIVAQALTALARYVRVGVPSIALKRNLPRAVEYLRHSALYLDDEGAQFELAKLHLTGDGVKKAVPHALHWLAVLSRKGNASAQAFLADLYWRGKYTRKDPQMALALINVAIDNAPPEDTVWIEDIHQNIFCGATIGTRKTVSGLVADWRKKYGRRRVKNDRYGLSSLGANAVRTCANGDIVRKLRASVTRSKTKAPVNPSAHNASAVEGSGAASQAAPALPGVSIEKNTQWALHSNLGGPKVPNGTQKNSLGKGQSGASVIFGGMSFFRMLRSLGKQPVQAGETVATGAK